MTLNDVENSLDALSKEFDELFEEIIPLVSLEDKTLKEALKSQLPMQLQLESISKKANYLYDNAEVSLEDAYGNAVRHEMSDGYRSVTIAEAKTYAYANKEYKHAKRITIKAKRLRDEIKGCLSVVETRKYTCHSLTNAIVAGADNTIL